MACGDIPYATEQGNVLEEQGIPAEEQGILLAKTKIDPGLGFRYTQLFGKRGRAHPRKNLAVCHIRYRQGTVDAGNSRISFTRAWRPYCARS